MSDGDFVTMDRGLPWASVWCTFQTIATVMCCRHSLLIPPPPYLPLSSQSLSSSKGRSHGNLPFDALCLGHHCRLLLLCIVLMPGPQRELLNAWRQRVSRGVPTSVDSWACFSCQRRVRHNLLRVMVKWRLGSSAV